MTFPPSTCLSIDGLILDLFVGCDEEERAKKQPIEIDVWILLSPMPVGCVSDDLSETICYRECVECIQKAVEERRFQLIEHLAYHIHKALKKAYSSNADFAVRVKKVHCPVKEVTKGVSFTYYPHKETETPKPSRGWDWE